MKQIELMFESGSETPLELAECPLCVDEACQQASPAVLEEILIEEVSIDGMCGVY